MDFFTSLLKAYEKAEEIELVDQQNGDNPVLLPLYHTSLKSNGKNIIAVKLDQDGSFYKAEVMDDNQMIIFPVTANSVARSGSNPDPHPLVDKFSYYIPEVSQSQYDDFHKQLASWIAYCEEGKVKDFLMKIQHFILQTDFLSSILRSLYGDHYQREGLKITYSDSDGKNKTVDLSAYFLEFSIVQFHGFKDESVTSYKALHQSFISFMTANQDNLRTCNISGRMEQITNKHRGLMGTAKIISVSNKGEAYKGRFKEREDVFSVGYETSEKIHLMIKYLLENKNSSTWLGSSQYLINWFSDDLVNESQLDIVKPIFNDLFEDDEEESLVPIKPNEESRQIESSFIKGQKLFGNDATYYIAILNKTSNGRIALKYFRQVQVSQLLKNLETWQEDYSWEAKTKSGNYKLRTPTFNEIINAAYGVDRERYLELDNDSFKSDQYQQLVTALIDGRSIPNSVVKKLEDNIKQRQKYSKHWYQVQQVSLAVLQKQYGREFTPMLDHQETDRSYLFGRLLAIYELFEAQRYALDGSSQERITNAERYWNAYTGQPAKMMKHLENKIKPYEEVLKLNRPGIWHKLEKERKEIIQLLTPLYANKEFTQPLDYKFIFGYYAEKQFYYTKQTKENEG
ncbi:type I-C CRISPR-associated protein Cas8c/Csd1 [Streptococcus constellatus]|uniref:CRISPR-associated protein Cas8c/Csd1, subtype I-C/DVULG n=1 Tax=Streptococcus constellatus subsp. constellatus SK53 TaxID=1095730 RepID=A0AAD2Y480_STRCV|nr:type I-C CRISPR-associated protein Cas8c/Csd1 [Streptococcus constellatus]EID21028.1 CRISPR-associated protein Cas8c/Csd1, subtype I-C/DVULG [Streptococcus constellatus subsp. constellatus SK53]MDP1485737.1 type I-C CRISPR-associated protein Cas8c/Csd1 [Streptococcus constellatus]QQT05526.1 type I-C CRISPR-associated protein Cas8c/Csd1 [Streptococcus constellatus]SUN40056.1 CRISPR-associated protein csd1 [Streptococcus constellatus]BBD22116.1 CRISPR-associated protein [Streptococcus constel